MITELTAAEYRALGVDPDHCYNTPQFTELNAGKVHAVHHLAWMEDGKLRAALILGEDDVSLRSPFSAPFGGFICTREPSDELVERIYSDLREYASAKCKRLSITFPPEFYSSCVSAFVIRAINTPWISVTADYNYHFITSHAEEYEKHLPYKERRKLRITADSGLQFKSVTTPEEKQQAYEVIRLNREAQNYPLRMTFEQLQQTAQFVPVDYFIMHDAEGNAVAAAICYHVTRDVVQLIYWGDLLEYRRLHPMNLLAMKLFRHYHREGVSIVDIGPASTDGIPNRGLCSFKRSVACQLGSKITVSI